MEFWGTVPRMSSAMVERVNMLLPEKCDGWQCSSGKARYVRRRIHAAVTIHIQCQMCGKSFGALKRAEVYNWQDLDEWDEDIRINWQGDREAERQKRLEALPSFPPFDDRKREFAERQADYRNWLRTSPDWRTLRDRVMRRAMFICEACLGNRANDVHHLTYELGRLPPAWELRAVCRECHDRLHDWVGGGE